MMGKIRKRWMTKSREWSGGPSYLGIVFLKNGSENLRERNIFSLTCRGALRH